MININPKILAEAAIVGVPFFVGLIAAKWILYRVIKKIASRTVTKWDDLVADAINKFGWFYFLIISISVGWKAVAAVPTSLHKLVIILSFYQIAKILSLFISFGFQQRIEHMKDHNQKNILQLLSFAAKLAAYAAVVLACLDNLGIDVTALVAGLGIGGIAIALAVQSTLTDLLSSLSIILDRPFEVGDVFEAEGIIGTVEKIGIKTTRVRATTGEEIVFPNSKLLQGQIRNYRRMDQRRVVFMVGVIYETPQEKLKLIPKIIEKVITSQKDVRFDRAHFSNLAAYSLDFEIVYWVQSREFAVYRDVHQAVLYDLFAAFAKEGIEFAYPTNVQYTKVIGEKN